MSDRLGTEKVSDEDLLERIRECYDAGRTLSGGGVTVETAAEDLPIVPETAKDRLRVLADKGVLVRDWGFSEHGHRLGYRPAEDQMLAEIDGDDDDREIRADGSGYVWDHENCPRDDCEGELQQQDEFNVLCLSCDRVWSHYNTGEEHILITPDQETVARKPHIATDGGLERFGVDCPEPEAPTDEHNERIATNTSDDYRYMRPQCRALTGAGDRCSNPIERGGSDEFCPRHADVDVETIDDHLETDGGTRGAGIWSQWQPTSEEKQTTCRNCGAQVSRQFARVSGDNNDVPHACPDCTTNREVHRKASGAIGGGV